MRKRKYKFISLFLSILFVISIGFSADTYRVIRDGTLIKTTDPIVLTTKLNQTPTAIVPLDAGLTIPADVSFLSPACLTANAWITLPTPVIGKKIFIGIDATGYEIRPALQTQYINNTECTPNKELAVSADTAIECIAVKAGTTGEWIITKFSNVGAPTGAGTPD